LDGTQRQIAETWIFPPKEPDMPDKRQALGRRGENYAAHYLAAQGYRVLTRNWRCASGEIDLVAEKAAALIFVEVRTRRGDRWGTPEESITPAKRAKLIAAAQTYLDEHGQANRDWRIDVVAIEIGSRGEVQRCTLIENAIEET
jgi:putative endonuclease